MRAYNRDNSPFYTIQNTKLRLVHKHTRMTPIFYIIWSLRIKVREQIYDLKLKECSLSDLGKFISLEITEKDTLLIWKRDSYIFRKNLRNFLQHRALKYRPPTPSFPGYLSFLSKVHFEVSCGSAQIRHKACGEESRLRWL